MKKHVFTIALDDPATLCAALAARLSIDPARAAAWVRRGAVQVDGRRAADSSEPVRPGLKIVVRIPDDEDGASAAAPPVPLLVVYRDPAVLVIDKPAGVPTQATPSESASALEARVRAELAAEARAMHRLDRDASGLVLFAAEAEDCAPLQAALNEGAIERRYLAVVQGRLEGEGVMQWRIARDSHDVRRRVALPPAAPGGQAATSRWRALGPIEAGADSTALELSLETGRTHQLRVHLQALGHPILGDRLYGGRSAERLCLHAHRLSFPHPRNGRTVELEAAMPQAMARLTPATRR